MAAAEQADCELSQELVCASFCERPTRAAFGAILACAERIAGLACDDLPPWEHRGSVCPELVCEKAIGGDPALNEEYFGGYTPAHLSACKGSGGDVEIGGRVATRLFRGIGVTEEDLRYHTRGLQRFFERYELWFHVDEAPAQVDLSAFMSATREELESAARAAGLRPDVEPTPLQKEAFLRTLTDLVFKDAKGFLRQHAQPPARRVNVVVLERFADEEIEGLVPPFLVIGGLGISPTLLQRSEDQQATGDLRRMLGLPMSFTPTLFVFDEPIREHVAYPDEIVAHEMGHALGLAHTDERGNLMQESSDGKCLPWLSKEQAGQLVGVQALARLWAGPNALLLPDLLRSFVDGATGGEL